LLTATYVAQSNAKLIVAFYFWSLLCFLWVAS